MTSKTKKPFVITNDKTFTKKKAFDSISEINVHETGSFGIAAIQGDKCIKIHPRREYGYVEFIKFCNEVVPTLPAKARKHFPKIKSARFGPHAISVEMEALDAVGLKEYQNVEPILEGYCIGECKDGLTIAVNALTEHVKSFQEKTGKPLRYDIHDNNIMYRKAKNGRKTFVFTDPFWCQSFQVPSFTK